MKKMLFVLNPCAGMRKANKFLPEILSLFNRADYLVITHVTAAAGEAIDVVARLAPEMDIVVCCGGDGTFNEAVNGLLKSGVQIPLGYIPAGSTNDFATSLKLPAQPVEAARAIVEGGPHNYDIGAFADRYFSYVASFGAFTRASYSTPQSVKNALGHTAYILEGINELSQIRKFHVKLELDGIPYEDDYLFGAISNSTSVAGILTLDPRQVDMCDGKFEVLLVRAPRDLLEISDCIRALQSQTYNCGMITFQTASNIRVTGGQELVWTLDGERAPWQAVTEVRNLHNAITLMK